MGDRDHNYECEQCGHMRGGLNDIPCDCDQHDLFGTWAMIERLSCLAHNLAVSAALCRSYALGAGIPIGPGEQWPLRTGIASIPAADWKPGCQRPAPEGERR